MASRTRAVNRTLTRAAITPRLGNLKYGPSGPSGGKKGPTAGTLNVNFQSPGMPQQLDQDAINFQGLAYAQNLYVMRCIQTIAATISGLPFRAGLDPTNPANFDPFAPMAQLLGPASPQAPGGPNPTTSSRMFWDWSIKQYRTYGRICWETQLAKMVGPGGRRTQDAVVALWPLPAPYITPIPTNGGEQMFDGYSFQLPNGEKKLSMKQVFYAHKPSMQDWRLPESVLDAARFPVNIATGLDKYVSKLLANDMVATTMVVSPPFAETAGRRAFRQQFRSRFTGVDNAGGTIFGEAHRATDDTSGNPLIQVEKIAQTAVEAGMIQLSEQAKIDITIALGVPISIIGNASQRTYANADSEYKNFWTITILPMIEDLQDLVNALLAPRMGPEVGWFDLSHVEALKPESILAPPMVGDLINFGVADAAQVANLLGIPAVQASEGGADTSTVDIDVESATSTQLSGGGGGGGGGGGRAEEFYRARRRALEWTHRRHTGEPMELHKLYGVTAQQMVSARLRWEKRPLNTANVSEPFIIQRYIEREHIQLAKPKDITPQAAAVEEHTRGILERRSAEELENRRIASAALAERVEALAEQHRGDREIQEYLADVEDALEAERAEVDTFDQDDALTTWDGDPDTFDAWVDANSGMLEAMANGA